MEKQEQSLTRVENERTLLSISNVTKIYTTQTFDREDPATCDLYIKYTGSKKSFI